MLRWFRRQKPPTDERGRTPDAPTPAPTDHVNAQPAETGAPIDPTKKKRRRGSRGGRNRKRSGAAAAPKADADQPKEKPAKQEPKKKEEGTGG